MLQAIIGDHHFGPGLIDCSIQCQRRVGDRPRPALRLIGRSAPAHHRNNPDPSPGRASTGLAWCWLPAPRLTTPTRWPRSRKCRASAITTGVLPAPPTHRLPTTITGTSGRFSRARVSIPTEALMNSRQTRDRKSGGRRFRPIPDTIEMLFQRRTPVHAPFSWNCNPCRIVIQAFRTAQQLIMTADFNNPPLVQYHHGIGFLDGCQTMRDDQRGPVGHQHFQRLLHFLLGLGIQRRGCLIQHQNRRVFQQCPGNRQTLTLTTGQQSAVLADRRIESQRQLLDKFPSL